MPIRLIQFHGTASGRRGWLGPVVLVLAILGGVVLLFVGAIFSLALVAAGTLVRLLTFTPGRHAEPGRQSFPAFMGGLFKKLFFKGSAGSDRNAWPGRETERTEAGEAPGVEKRNQAGGSDKTISLDRGKDGVWRP